MTTAVDENKIESLLRSILNSDDAIQDAWLWILEEGLENSEDVESVADLIKRRYQSESFRHKKRYISLGIPLPTESGTLTLADICPAPEDQYANMQEDKPRRKRKRNGKEQYGISIRLDNDVVGKLEERYPDFPHRLAIRALLGMSLDKRTWSAWEEQILRDKYPTGGSNTVALDVPRSFASIHQHALALGIKFERMCPIDDMINTSELAVILHVSQSMIRKLVHENLLHPLRSKGKRHGYFLFKQEEIRTNWSMLCARVGNYT